MPRRNRSAPSRPAARPAATAQSRSDNRKQAAPAQNTPVAAPTQAQTPMMTQTPMSAPMPYQQPSLLGQVASTAAGVAIGHSVGHAITGMFSGGSQHAQAAPVAQEAQSAAPINNQVNVNPCEADNKALLKCLEQNPNDIGTCQMYFDMLNECNRSLQMRFQ